MITTLFGMDVRQLIGGLTYLFELSLTILFFTRAYKKKSLFGLRLAGIALCGLGYCILFAYLRTLLSDTVDFGLILFRITAYLGIALLLLGGLLFCYREKLFELLIAWASAEAARCAFANIYYLLIVLTGHDPVNSNSILPIYIPFVDFLLYYVLLVLSILYPSRVFSRRNRANINRSDTITLHGISIGIVLADSVLLSAARPFESESFGLALAFRISSLFCFLYALGLLLGLIKWNRLSEELTVTEQLLLREKRYYQQSKANVETINRMTHDLKHRLNSIADKLNEEELQSLRQAMELYDSNIKTGYEVLDTILYEKQLYCIQNGVRLTCMADGSLVKHLSPSHLYSLFDNAIDNAVEAVRKLPDPESRLVCINIDRVSNGTEIVVYNYYDAAGDVEDTSKSDRNRHGYGIASMRSVAEQYGGTFSIRKQDGIFTVTVFLPAEQGNIG